jgi:LPXTG-motif cell wall-anchored protein
VKNVERGEMMKKKVLSAGLVLGNALSLMIPAVSPIHAQENAKVTNIEFIGMEAPKTIEDMAKIHTTAKVKVTYSDDTVKEAPLAYNKLYQTDEKIVTNKGEKIAAGTPIDAKGNPIIDKSVPNDPVLYVSDAPDSNSLLNPLSNDGSLYLVTHYEYDTLDHSGSSAYGKVPASMTITKLMQNKETGELKVVDASKADISAGNGLWIPCNGSLSPWNTHLSSEEYEPDARTFEADPGDKTNVKSFAKFYFGDESKANPYYYGFIPEVTINADSTHKVVKHYSTGRKSNELMKFMPDKRTAYFGDDGSYTTLFMYVADKEADLSAGTLYAAKFKQTSTENGGSGDLEWIKLGHATDSEVKQIIDSGVKFSDIFETSDVPKEGFKAIKQYSYGQTEYLKLKPGMEKAAAFLETRRYAAMLGATSEFNKMEGLTVNEKDHKAYVAISDLSKGMEDNGGKDPVDDIRLPKISAGATFELDLKPAQKDAAGNDINSHYVASTMKAFVVGEDLKAADPYGNMANPDKVASPDNLSYSEEMRTLFIGEDSSKHINNFMWAYNVDTKKLTRILSIPVGAESTGLQVADNRNGFTYIMSNFQHPRDELDNYKPTAIDIDALKAQIDKTIGIDMAGMVGYLSLGNILHPTSIDSTNPGNGGGTGTSDNGNTTPGTSNGGTVTPPRTNISAIASGISSSANHAQQTSKAKKQELPDTATSVYGMMGIGAVLAAIGAFFYRKKAAK